jgi:hypothetical protein
MEALINDIVWIVDYDVKQIKEKVALQDRLKEIYYNAFLERLVITCGNCIGDALVRLEIFLRKYNLQIHNAMNDAKYRLKKGFIIDLTYSGGGYVTADNVTDDIARGLIQKNSAYLDFFEAYPKDEVKALLEGKSDDTVTDADIVGANVAEVDKSASDGNKVDSANVPVPTREQLVVKTKDELMEMLGEKVRLNKDQLIDKVIEKLANKA